MAENPYVNKVVFGNDTLVDLTEDSVTANTLLEGETAHSASGEPITGTAKQGHIIWNAIKTALTQRTKLWFADAKVTDDSTEQATKVEVVQLIDDESELTNAPDGVYQGDYDDAPEGVLDASMVAYNDGSVKDALDVKQVSKTYDVSSSTFSTLSYFGNTAYLGSVVPETSLYGKVSSFSARTTSQYPCVCSMMSNGNINFISSVNADVQVRIVYDGRLTTV
jgi:hypothetical protein